MANQIQSCFERYEKKYMLTPAQLRVMLTGMEGPYGPRPIRAFTICNIYYDTPDWRLIRASGKPYIRRSCGCAAMAWPCPGRQGLCRDQKEVRRRGL